MFQSQQIKHYEALNQWFKSPLGLMIAQEFSDILDSLSELLRGETLLQLGNGGENGWLNHVAYDYKWIASPLKTGSHHIECSLSQLPFQRNSLNCILAPLTLELFGSSLSVLDEMDRILKPMGYLVFMSFNPWSLWGAALKCGFLAGYRGKIKLRTPYHLNRILLQRGYVQSALINFCYLPPINNQNIINKRSFFNEIGKMLWPFPSGLYCYVAQKYEYSPMGFIQSPIKSTRDYKSSLQPVINKI